MIALVSGSSGFCGKPLIAALEADGAKVVRISARSTEAGVRRLDPNDVLALRAVLEEVRPEAVFHLHGAASAEDWSTLVRVNTLAAAALLDAARGMTSPAPTFVLVGSAAEYGPMSDPTLPISETASLRPSSPYGATKRAQTELGLLAARRGQRVIIARPSNIIGRGMPRYFALASFAHQLAQIERGLRPAVLSVGNLESIRDFVDVADVARDYISLAKNPAAVGQTFNVSSGVRVRVRDALDALISAFGLSVEVRTDPELFRPDDVSVFWASRARLDELLGSRTLIPLEVSLGHLVADARADCATKFPVARPPGD